MLKRDTFDQLVRLIRLFRPKFYNKLAWLVVISGLALLTTPIWEQVLVTLLRSKFNLHISVGNDQVIGLTLVVFGLFYHFATTSLYEFFGYRARVQPNEERHLEVACNPTRDGNTQLAQIRLYNSGFRPISIDSWWVEWDECGLNSGELYHTPSPFPVRLADEDRIDFLINISSQPVATLVRVGVIDSRKKLWLCSEENLAHFRATALDHSSGSSSEEKGDGGIKF